MTAKMDQVVPMPPCQRIPNRIAQAVGKLGLNLDLLLVACDQPITRLDLCSKEQFEFGMAGRFLVGQLVHTSLHSLGSLPVCLIEVLKVVGRPGNEAFDACVVISHQNLALSSAVGDELQRLNLRTFGPKRVNEKERCGI